MTAFQGVLVSVVAIYAFNRSADLLGPVAGAALPALIPVVTLGLCIGHINREIEINLADRSNFKYVMLVGRDFLRDTYVVDSAKTLTIEPNCQ